MSGACSPPQCRLSFDDGAGMDRLISAAGFVHSNMPDGTAYDAPVLSADARERLDRRARAAELAELLWKVAA